MDLELRGGNVIVTGGSRGIGRAIVLGLAAQGATVTGCFVHESDAVEALRKELAALGARAELVRCDVTDAAQTTVLAARVSEAHGPITGLVNNAGVISHLPLEALTPDEWHRIVDTNLTGVYHLSRAALPHFANDAAIVNISSAVAHHGMPAAAHYVASKAGVMGLTRALAKELGPRGIRVNCIAAGLIETDQMQAVSEEGKARYRQMIALGRLGRPEEIADAVLFLLSRAAGYISGATLDADGGI